MLVCVKLIQAEYATGNDFLRALNSSSTPNRLWVQHSMSIVPGERVSMLVMFPGIPEEGIWLSGNISTTNTSLTILDGMQDERINFLVNAALGNSNESHNRKFSRVPLKIRAEFLFGSAPLHQTGTGETHDISFGGFSLRTSAALPLGTQVQVVLYTDDTPIHCSGKVVWRRDDASATGAGIEFGELKGNDLRKLREIVHSAKSSGQTEHHPS